MNEDSVSLRINNLPLPLLVPDGSLRLEHLLELLSLLRFLVLFLSSWQILLWLWLASLGFLWCFLLILRCKVNHLRSLCFGSLKFTRLILGLLVIILLHSVRFLNILHAFRRNDLDLIILRRSILSIIIAILFRWSYWCFLLFRSSRLFDRGSFLNYLRWCRCSLSWSDLFRSKGLSLKSNGLTLLGNRSLSLFR